MLDQILENPENLKTLALVAMAIGFEIAERVLPYQKIGRRAVGLDVVAFVVLALALSGSGALLEPAWRLLERDGIRPFLETCRGLPSPVKVLAGLAVVDVSLYWIHRAMHRFDVLWRAHEWHHSSENLYWFSGFRTSLVHVFLYAIPQVGLGGWLFRPSPLEALAAGLIAIFLQIWMHANVPVSLGPLEWVVVSPRYHRVHHAIGDNRFVNLANFFPIWDHLFGTYVDPASFGDGFKTGLGYPKSTIRMIVGV